MGLLDLHRKLNEEDKANFDEAQRLTKFKVSPTNNHTFEYAIFQRQGLRPPQKSR